MSPPAEPQWDFFAPAGGAGDPWYPKVADWQERALSETASPLREPLRSEPARSEASGSATAPDLRGQLAGFEAAERRVIARRIQQWALAHSRRLYRADPSEDPEYDHWPTTEEFIEAGGDDCDGLDLTAYRLLREFGFPKDRVFRLVLRNDEGRKSHMVTVWFESDTDPWVLDGTGAAAPTMRPFSKVENWTPTKLFNEWSQYQVIRASSTELSIR